MSFQFYQVIHLFSAIMLAGVAFAALANPLPERRRQILILSGVAALLALVSGFGLLGIGRFGFPGWIVIKLAAWLALAAIAGIAFRRPQQARPLAIVVAVAVLLAVGAAVLKPF
ncbi:MAG: hypothetical protein OXF27_09770 [Acidobacteria bacterium]|nr:hypothetical protein [Acidobacteriota bacterium]